MKTINKHRIFFPSAVAVGCRQLFGRRMLLPLQPRVLNTSLILREFGHTVGIPQYATNPSVLDHRRGLYLLRITPLSYICSPVHTSVITQHQYADNSHTAIVAYDKHRSIVLGKLHNSQDARGVLEDEDVTVLGAAARGGKQHRIWVIHTTEVNRSSGEQLGRMEARRYRITLGEAPSTRLLSRVRFHAEGGWHLQQLEKNWAFLAFVREPRTLAWNHEPAQELRSALVTTQRSPAHLARAHSPTPQRARAAANVTTAALFSYSLSPHIVLRCSLLTGGCIQAHRTDSAALWASAMSTLDDLPAYRHPPRCGTPCLHLGGRYVCLGHVKTRMRRQYKSTYFQFFYALAASPPYSVVNVSHPFRLRTLDANFTRGVHAMLGATFSPRKQYHTARARGRPFDEERIQFASGMVLIDGRRLLLSYGINDCIGATRELALNDVEALLERRFDPPLNTPPAASEQSSSSASGSRLPYHRNASKRHAHGTSTTAAARMQLFL